MTCLARILKSSKRAAGLVAVLLLWLLAQLPLAASGPTYVLSESRVWAPAVENQTFTGADRLLSLELHRSNAPPTVLCASDCSVSPTKVVPNPNAGNYLAGKAPKQVTPGTKVLEGQYVDDLGRVQPWKAHYDDYGRQIGRTDYNAGNKAAAIPDTHHHTYDYNGQYPKGVESGAHIDGEFTP